MNAGGVPEAGPGAAGGPGGYGGIGAARTAPAGLTFNVQSGGIFRVFQPRQRKEVNTAFYSIGERKSVFEDKLAVSTTGQHSETDSRGWIRMTSNYLVSKAYVSQFFEQLEEKPGDGCFYDFESFRSAQHAKHLN